MTQYFYLVNCENKNPFTVLGDKEYIHVKAHVEGKQVAIISFDELSGENIEEKTKEELQIILDEWIDAENINPEKDVDNNDILQNKIDINKFIKE